MKILILGADGYIGWPLYLHLQSLGHEVHVWDNGFRRELVKDVRSESVVPISSRSSRGILNVDVRSEPSWIRRKLSSDIQPDCIVHLAEQPSAPYSMRDLAIAGRTYRNNVEGTLNVLWAIRYECPNAHLLKLGTMGEYGTPDCEIPEGHFPEHSFYGGPGDEEVTAIGGLPFPRRPGSFYHASKVSDSVNIEFACSTWGLRSTDVMQGVVYGTTTPALEAANETTRFDVDECFGTVINRFCAQAVAGIPLTVYGKGGQTRGYLPLRESIECLTLAIDNPPSPGEYRVFNQFAETYSVLQLAKQVSRVAAELGLHGAVMEYPNPRVEKEEHFYQPAHDKLAALGYRPKHNLPEDLEQMIQVVQKYKDRIPVNKLLPRTQWK